MEANASECPWKRLKAPNEHRRVGRSKSGTIPKPELADLLRRSIIRTLVGFVLLVV